MIRNQMKYALFIVLIAFINVHCSTSNPKFMQRNIKGITLQEMIPGEPNQKSTWEIHIPSTSLEKYTKAYYKNAMGLIQVNMKSSQMLISGYLSETNGNIPDNLKQALINNKLIIQQELNADQIDYIIIDEFSILEPIYLPSQRQE